MSLFQTNEADQCKARVEYATNRDPTVKFMIEKLEEVRTWASTADANEFTHSYDSNPVLPCQLNISRTLAGRLQSAQELHQSREVHRSGRRRIQAGRWGKQLWNSLLHPMRAYFPLPSAPSITFQTVSGHLQVVVCSNHLPSQEEVKHALVHELLHAYDHCRAADLDWSNCEHHACSEVHSILH